MLIAIEIDKYFCTQNVSTNQLMSCSSHHDIAESQELFQFLNVQTHVCVIFSAFISLLYMVYKLIVSKAILVPRVSPPRATFVGPWIVVFKAHTLESGRFSTRNSFHREVHYYEETRYLC